MPDPDVKINIEVTKSGAGAQQAKQEIDGLKQSADSATTSTGNLHFKLVGFRTILSSISMMAQGGAQAIAGLGRALGGVVMILSNTVWGRIAMIAATVVSIGAALYQKFFSAKEAVADTGKAVEQVSQKLEAADWETTIAKAREAAKAFAAELDKAAQAAEATRKQLDEIGDAELSATLAGIDLRVAQGGMTKEQGQLARIDARQAAEAQKNEREKAALQTAIAEKEQQRANIDLQMQYKTRDAKEAAEAYSQALGWGGNVAGLDLAKQDFAGQLAGAGSPEERSKIFDSNAAKKRYEEAERARLQASAFSGEATAKLRADIEAAQAKLKALGFRGQALETGSTAQRLTVASGINAQKDAEDIRQASERAAYNAQVQAEQEKRREAQARAARAAAGDRASQILDQQQAEEESAQIQFQAATRDAGARGLSPRERARRQQAAQAAGGRYSREQADVYQAKALQTGIRDAVSPEDVAKLLAALESIGNAFKTVAAAANEQASQIKNGGLRTK
jgi:hypothetical protein